MGSVPDFKINGWMVGWYTESQGLLVRTGNYALVTTTLRLQFDVERQSNSRRIASNRVARRSNRNRIVAVINDLLEPACCSGSVQFVAAFRQQSA